jgi:hypothetical protein
MVKALAVGLSLVLSIGVASAQPKKATTRKRPVPTKKADPKAEAPAPTPAAPEAKPSATATELKLPGGSSDAKAPAASPTTPAAGDAGGQPTTTSASRPPAPTVTPPAKPGDPLKTDEKVGTNEKLDKRGTGDYRDVSPENERLALIAFREANQLFNDGLFPKAAEKYRVALSHWDHPAIHYNLALALINMAQPIEVHEQLNKALQYGPAPIDQEKYDRAQYYLRLVEGQLADVEVSCNQAGAKISVDNNEVFTAPGKYTAKVRAGKHTFHGDKQGYNARVETPYVGAGEKFRIELKVYTDPELTRHKRRWATKTWLPYAVIGTGVVVGAVGGLFHMSAQTSYDSYNARVAECPRTDPCSNTQPELVKLRDSGDSKTTLGYVGYGIAGAAVVTGVTLMYINRAVAYRITPEQLEREKGLITVAPIVSPEMAGAMVQGKF